LPEWLIERGIGETRAALVEGGEIIEARVELDGAVPAGTIFDAQLVDVGRGGRNAVARDDGGREYLLPNGTGAATQGSTVRIEVVRPAIPGGEHWKRPLARVTDRERRRPTSLAERLRSTGLPVRELAFPGARDELGDAGWGELMEQAASGIVDFAGGSLGIFATPAMSLIDVDGWGEPGELAIAGAAEAARAVRRLTITGSIGIDLPTAPGKAARQSAATAIDDNLPQPFERTAVNGFGFVQIVRPRTGPSLIELWSDRAAAEARALLRRAGLEPPGPKRLVAHPAVIAVLDRHPDWTEALARQVGGAIALRPKAKLPISGGHAEQG